MEITEEMRSAVIAEQAAACDHVYDLSQMAAAKVTGPDGLARNYVSGADPAQLPHIRCTGCRHVWLIVDEPGRDYDHAVELLAERFGVATDDARVEPRWTSAGQITPVETERIWTAPDRDTTEEP